MERHPVGILPPPNPPRDSPPDCRKRCGFDHRLRRPVLYPLSYGRLNRNCATNLNCLPICRSIHGASSGRHPASPESATRQSTGLSQALRIRPPAWKAGAVSIELRAPEPGLCNQLELPAHLPIHPWSVIRSASCLPRIRGATVHRTVASAADSTTGLEGRCSIRRAAGACADDTGDGAAHPSHRASTRRTTRRRTGRGRGIRTPDILLPKQARYQTALYPAFDRCARIAHRQRVPGNRWSDFQTTKGAAAPFAW